MSNRDQVQTDNPVKQWVVATPETEHLPKYSIWKAEGDLAGNWSGAIRVMEGNREVWLPVKVDDSNRKGINFVLKNLGCVPENGVEIEMSEKQKQRTQDALRIMPPILAFNYGASNGFDDRILDLYDTKDITPVIVPSAPPRRGKTLGIISSYLANKSRIAIWDLDPFSGQSISACLSKINQKMGEKLINPKERLSDVVDTIVEVYLENQKFPNQDSKNDIKLGEVLDTATADYLVNIHGKGKIAVLADVAGFTEDTKRWSHFRLLGQILPSINLDSNDKGGIPKYLMPPEGPADRGYCFMLYDRIAANLGGREPMRNGNQDQYCKAMNAAKEDQKYWQNYFSQ